MSMNIIALGGLKRSGKDTFANILAVTASSRGLTPHRIAFADPLRQAAKVAYNLDDANPFGDEVKDTVDSAWGITRRQMLINVGEAMRGVDADHWTKLLMRGIDRFETAVKQYTPSLPALHIVTDMRRPNEAKALLDLGATLVLVVRDGIVWNGHETEAMAGMVTAAWRKGHSWGVGYNPYHHIVENAFPVNGDALMIPTATAAFENAAHRLIDAVLSTVRG